MFVLFCRIKMEINLALKGKRNIVEELVEKQEIWAFIDTECRTDKNTSFKWNTLFQAFQSKEFQVLLQDDLSTELSKGIYKNISRSRLYRVATKPPVLPCPDVVEWITRRIDHEIRTIHNFEGNHVVTYKAPMLNQMYHFK